MLQKENRLSKKSDFENVRQNGRFISSKNFTVSFVRRPAFAKASAGRFGFIVSKKISTKAHERNRVKRILREIIRKNLDLVKNGMDYVIIVKPSILHASHGTLEIELKDVIKNI